MTPNSQNNLTEFRLDQQGKALDHNTMAVAEMKLELTTQGAKLDNLSADLKKVTNLLYTVLGAFVAAIATSISKIVIKSGASL